VITSGGGLDKNPIEGKRFSPSFHERFGTGDIYCVLVIHCVSKSIIGICFLIYLERVLETVPFDELRHYFPLPMYGELLYT
jgi:hypothetical protein